MELAQTKRRGRSNGLPCLSNPHGRSRKAADSPSVLNPIYTVVSFRKVLSSLTLAVLALTAGTGCSQSITAVASGIRAGTSKESVESSLGKPDEVIQSQSKENGRQAGGRSNFMYSYKNLDREYDLWVTFDTAGKVIWATPHDKSTKLFVKGM